MPITPFMAHPVTGDAFVGRQRLVRNLRGRIANGESVAVIGGPKLGKTSLDGLPDRRVIEVNLREEPSPNRDEMAGAMLVLDNLDHLPVEEIDALLAQVSTACPRNIILTGGHRLRTLLGHSSTLPRVTIRLYPLSVLLDGELRQLVGSNGSRSFDSWRRR
ncbi:MAG: hypothetical protein HY348_06775 [Nitrospira defluvii]|nr:hypothetical protein [Nitrospira defluvii]